MSQKQYQANKPDATWDIPFWGYDFVGMQWWKRYIAGHYFEPPSQGMIRSPYLYDGFVDMKTALVEPHWTSLL